MTMPSTAPPAPQNVRAFLSDGTVMAVELVYVGQDEEGVHRWEPVRPLPSEPVGVLAEVLPAKTGISITWEA